MTILAVTATRSSAAVAERTKSCRPLLPSRSSTLSPIHLHQRFPLASAVMKLPFTRCKHFTQSSFVSSTQTMKGTISRPFERRPQRVLQQVCRPPDRHTRPNAVKHGRPKRRPTTRNKRKTAPCLIADHPVASGLNLVPNRSSTIKRARMHVLITVRPHLKITRPRSVATLLSLRNGAHRWARPSTIRIVGAC